MFFFPAVEEKSVRYDAEKGQILSYNNDIADKDIGETNLEGFENNSEEVNENISGNGDSQSLVFTTTL